MILNQMARHSLEILQLPQLELAAFIAEEIDRNPLLEGEPDNFLPAPMYLHAEPLAKPSLYEHLLSQIRESFPEDDKLAIDMIDHLDERGFLSISPEELSNLFFVPIQRIQEILKTLQTFDPPGIFARNLQEAFMIQLELQGQKDSLAFKLVQHAFDDFLQGRYGAIKKKLQPSAAELSAAIQKLARLSSRPAALFNFEIPQPIYPDLHVKFVDSQWMVETREEALPKFRIKTEYLHLPSLSAQQKKTMQMFSASAKWLSRSINQRRKLLLFIGMYILRKQTDFFEGRAPISPIPAIELAMEFGVHESTISRAILNKYIAGPWGLMRLKNFVSSHSNATAKKLLERIIFQEQSPLTDSQVAERMKNAGCPIARRTVAKYRNQMKIGSASVRKHAR